MEGGREGRPVGPHISSSLNPTLQSLPSPYSPLEKFPLLRKPRKEVGRS
jgi:hypothetical protein